MRKTLALSILFTTIMALSSAGARAQGKPSDARYELGGGVVGSFYDKKTFTSTGGNADAGFDPGFGASAWLGHQMYAKVSGEVRYDYMRNGMKLEGTGGKATFSGDSHAIHYDVHIHFAEVSAKTRPYLIAGGGVKLFRGIGEERAFQPLSQIAVLTQATDMKPLVTFGFGVKMSLTDRVSLRLEFRDNLTRFPKKVIAPNRGSGGDGWINNFAPTAGLSFLF